MRMKEAGDSLLIQIEDICLQSLLNIIYRGETIEGGMYKGDRRDGVEERNREQQGIQIHPFLAHIMCAHAHRASQGGRL